MLAGILVLGLAPIAAAQTAPAIVFDGLIKDFGAVPEGVTLMHVFTFTNRGKDMLEILKVEPG